MNRTIIPVKYSASEVLPMPRPGTLEFQCTRSLIRIRWRQMYPRSGWALMDISPSNLSNEQFPQIQSKFS